MRENMTSGEVIERLVQVAGIRKKLAAELLRAIPEIIEDGLKSDGEVRVKGLGTFRMKWTQPRVGRNPKTGERVEIPAHNRLVFLPEQSFKEYINCDNRLLSYKVIPTAASLPEKTALDEPQVQPEPQSGTGSAYQPEPEPETFDQPEPQLQPEEEINYDLPVEPLPVKRKRRIHWIVPTAAALIVVLSLVFYFRNFYPVGSQQSAISSQRPDSIQNPEPVTRNPDPITQNPEPVTRNPDPITQNPDPGTRNPDPVTQNPDPVTRNPEPVTRNPDPVTRNPDPVTRNPELIISSEGKHLFRLAREVYGNPFLWVLIYRANLGKIPDPDMLISGKEIVIPALEGRPDKLTRNDSAAVSDGYRLVYEYYQAKGDTRAEDFHQGVKRYLPK